MKTADYLRHQVKELRELAASETDAILRTELLELARRCEQLANHMTGNGHPQAASPPEE